MTMTKEVNPLNECVRCNGTGEAQYEYGRTANDICDHCNGEGIVGLECDYCDGTGEAQESCCGRPLNDMGICTDCGEHTYACGDKCEECNGSGLSETTTK